MNYQISISNRQNQYPVDEARLREGVRIALSQNGIMDAQLDVAIVGAAEMQRLNNRHLGHDYPADVLSFLLDESEDSIEGEVIVCPATAREWSEKYGWPQEDELLLYAIHGTLHLSGHDDLTPEDESEMREAERRVLAEFQLDPPWIIKS